MKSETAQSPVILGAGRLATALAMALIERGRPPRAVVVRDLRRTRKLRKLLAGKVPLLRLRERPVGGLLIFAIRDRAIEEVATGLAERPDLLPEIGLHTAGALGPEPLAALADCGVATGVWHPLQSFDLSPGSAAGFTDAYFRVEGSAAACRAARNLTKLLQGHVFELPIADDRSRALYHAAASIVSNDLVAVWEAAHRTLTATGVTPEEARNALAPLAATTLQHLSDRDSRDALTGPLPRGDAQTIEKHLSALEREDPGTADLHRDLSRQLLERVLTSEDLSAAVRKRLRKTLRR